MLAYLEGRVQERTENSCILVTAAGVGYEVFLTERTLAELPAQGTAASFYISFIVREDAQELFGFSTWDERQTFRLLTSINRVGARTALSILSIFRPDDLRCLVSDDDASALTQVPGIGKKTAQQIFLELKYKLKIDGPVSFSSESSARSSIYQDALTGLSNLGYDDATSGQILRKILDDSPDITVGEALRAALKTLAGGKNK